jgi:hypothetical protein
MLVVSNLTWDDQQAMLNISGLFPGHRVSVTDVLSDKRLQASNGRLDLQIKTHQYVALRIKLTKSTEVKPAVAQPTSSPAPPDFRITKFDPAQWAINSKASGVTVAYNFDLGDGRKGVRLSSTPYQAWATAELRDCTIGRNGTISIWIRRSGTFGIELGDTGIYCDWAWHPMSTDRWNDGELFNMTSEPDKTQLLTISLKDGVLDAVYGNQPLARNLKLSRLTDRNTLKLTTWGGAWFAFDVADISSKPKRLFAPPTVKHPVR